MLPKWLSTKESTYKCSRCKSLGFYLWFENISGEGYVTYSIILAGKTPWREESGVIQSMQLQRVEYGLVTKLQYFNGSVHISSVQISHSVMSNSLWPRGLQHARLPCTSPTFGAYSHLCPLSWWCNSTISSSVVPFSPQASIFPSIRVFSNESVLLIRWSKYWSFSFSISPSNEYSRLISFRMDWLDLLAVQRTLKSPTAPQFKSINSLVLSFLRVQI